MYYSIFRNNALVTRVKPLDNSELSQKKQQEDIVRLNFVLDVFVEINVGDYILFEKTGYFYTLNKPPRVTESPKKYKYECIFEGPLHELRKTKIFLDTPKEGGGFYRDYKFPLTGNAETFLYFIVDNLNRNGGNYTAGIFKSTGTTTIDFNNWNAFEAISSISETLECNWYLEGTVLNFDSKDISKGYIFQVGRKSGFVELSRLRVDRAEIETVVYGYGSTENLPPRTSSEGTTYEGDTLTENRLSFEGEDGESKLTKNVDVYGRTESIQEFDIKPEFTGTVTTVNETDRRVFTDLSINFDINDYLISGVKPKITFLTGKLIGLTFNIAYDDGIQQITMDYYTDESGEYPNDIIYADVNDNYKIFDIGFPETYIIDAQQRLEEATQNYLNENSKNLETYRAVIDKEYISNKGYVLDLGDAVRIISFYFNLDETFEIKELKQSITDPNQYQITFGDTLPQGLISTLKASQFNTDQNIYNVQKTTITNNQIVNNIGGATEWQNL